MCISATFRFVSNSPYLCGLRLKNVVLVFRIKFGVGGMIKGISKVALATVLLSVAISSVSAQSDVDWTGFYAGVHGGYALDTARESSSGTPPTTVEIDPGEFYTFGDSSSQERIESLFGGVQAGYNYQTNDLVFGGEGTFSLGSLDKTNSQQTILNLTDGVNTSNNLVSNTATYSVDWLTTFAGRIGYANDGWLVYAKAGVAVADVSVDSQSELTNTSSPGTPQLSPVYNSTVAQSSSSAQLEYGPVVGLGFEKMLTSNISIGAEYNYVGLGDFTAATAAGGFGGLLGAGTGETTFSSNFHTISAKLNYHF